MTLTGRTALHAMTLRRCAEGSLQCGTVEGAVTQCPGSPVHSCPGAAPEVG